MECFEKLGFNGEVLNLIDNMYDEFCIWDTDYTLLYINRASYRHYGLYPEQLIGRNLKDLVEVNQFWSPSTLPYVYEYKKSVMQNQKTFLGIDILTITTPIFNQDGSIKFVVMVARDHYEHLVTKLEPVEMKDEGFSFIKDSKIIYNSDVMKNVMKMALKVARVDANCLILGETGTGKSMMAQYIHENSDRKDKKFFIINMASMNPNMIESELFGYKGGAFTGASREGKNGLFHLANQGVLFLDEIGELPYFLQAKFLHVLQNGEFMPIGSDKPLKTDVRIISATNCNLEDMVKAGTFREDLFHRLDVFELTMPPIRERGNDLEIMIAYYINLFNEKYKRNCTVSNSALELLRSYKWPGNVRELSNVVERCVVMAEQDVIDAENLPKHIFRLNPCFCKEKSLSETTDLSVAVEQYERGIVQYHYNNAKSTRKLATALNVSQTTARRLIDKYIKTEL